MKLSKKIAKIEEWFDRFSDGYNITRFDNVDSICMVFVECKESKWKEEMFIIDDSGHMFNPKGFNLEDAAKDKYSDQPEVLKWLNDFACKYEKDSKEIHVVIDEGGIFQGAYVTQNISDSVVELIDFVTEDPDEFEETEQRHKEAVERAIKGELVCLWN